MATRRGVLLFMLLAVVLGGAVLIGALRLRAPAGADSSSVLVFDVPAQLEESTPPARPFPFSSSRHEHLTVYDVVDGLDRAADDDRIEALVLHVDALDWGWAKVAEVRDAVLRFRAAGKPVYASLTGGSEREYLLATAADHVSMPPVGNLQLDGLSASAIYFRGTFDKLGVSPNFAHVGRYKSAVEPYTRGTMSDDARAALNVVLDELYGLLADSLASARRIPADSIRALIDRGPYPADEAHHVGLIDTLLYDGDVDSLAVHPGSRRLSALSMTRYLARLAPQRAGPRIALITAVGTIVPGKSRDLPGEGVVLGSETLVDAVREARTRKAIRAVVLRIDSPGGVAQASDDIWHEVERCRAVKPVIVSMSDYAASGGYYFAVAADSIVAQPSTLTGSIGIFGGKLNVLGLARKLGLNVETVSRGRHAEMLSPYRDFDPEEARLFQHDLEHFYRGFLDRVAHGRRMPTSEVDSLGQGRVWSGRAARDHRLVDRLGGFDVAFDMARARARIPRGEGIAVERLPRVQRSLLDRAMEELFSNDDDESLASLELPPVLRAWVAVARFPAGRALALMPYSLDIR